MQHSLTYSVIEHIKAQVPNVSNRVYWLYDGVTLTDKVKPFVTVEPTVNSSRSLHFGRLDYEETYVFTIGIRATSASELARLGDIVRTALRQPNITLYDTQSSVPTVLGVFYCSVGGTIPMPAENVSDETSKHRCYMDVEVTIYRRNGSSLI
ncbi:hypothetical protein [Paenibacillus abyssi]|uniref:Uncharacterized protein n=1 Tax=Paenibacillus abyssi TaxID=1340531 RepID=A0A917CHB9_9BACL|nr:hypothetical protein [Paenibacillus abyssi]GGF88472.1 hypothetical protein GCM10010916_02280 [Paenibacillus abyssi]